MSDFLKACIILGDGTILQPPCLYHSRRFKSTGVNNNIDAGTALFKQLAPISCKIPELRANG